MKTLRRQAKQVSRFTPFGFRLEGAKKHFIEKAPGIAAEGSKKL